MQLQVSFVSESARKKAKAKSSKKTTTPKPKASSTPKSATVTSWGSFQYEGALETFNKIQQQLNSPPTIEQALLNCGASVNYTKRLSDKEAVAKLKKANGGNFATVEASFKWAKDQSKDLWGWADEAAKACFSGLKIGVASSKNTVGPALNRVMQSGELLRPKAPELYGTVSKKCVTDSLLRKSRFYQIGFPKLKPRNLLKVRGFCLSYCVIPSPAHLLTSSTIFGFSSLSP